jgi:LysR family glycine cleavage system transcriptional activator
VLSEVLLPVCAPSLLTRAPLRKPADLANHVLLCSLNRPFDWPAWVAAAKVDHIDGNRGLKFENAALAYQAAIDGLGVMIAQWAFVEDDLATRRLVAPFELRIPTKRAYFLATHPHREKPARLRAFEEWILREAAIVGDRLSASVA